MDLTVTLVSNLFVLFTILSPAIFFTACSLDVPGHHGGNSLRITLEEKTVAAPGTSFPDSIFTALPQPSATSSINCFGVNVTGAGLAGGAGIGVNCTSSDNFHGHGQGLLSALVPRGSTIDVDVPAGLARTVDVFGFFPTPPNCGGLATNVINGGFFLGGTTLDLVAEASVVIPVSFTSGQAASVNCAGPPIPADFTFGTGADGAGILLGGSTINVTSDTTVISGRTFSAQRNVTGVDGTGTVLTVGAAITSADFQGTDEVIVVVSAAHSAADCGPADLTAGTSVVARVTASTGSTITLDHAITANPGSLSNANLAAASTGTAFCNLSVARVPNFTDLTINGGSGATTMTAGGTPFAYASTTTTAGIIAFRVRGTLDFHGGTAPKTIDSTFSGFAGGLVTLAGPGILGSGSNASGGAPGLTSSGGGGGGSAAASGGVGGGTSGGAGGSSYPACAGGACLFSGSGGGGGSTGGKAGGVGGGIIFIAAKLIATSGSPSIINASGLLGASSATANTGGGGAGGTIKVQTQSDMSAIVVKSVGGPGGNSGSTGHTGGGGAGGKVIVEHCTGTVTGIVSGGGGGTGGSAGGVAGSNGLLGDFVDSTKGFCSVP